MSEGIESFSTREQYGVRFPDGHIQWEERDRNFDFVKYGMNNYWVRPQPKPGSAYEFKDLLKDFHKRNREAHVDSAGSPVVVRRQVVQFVTVAQEVNLILDQNLATVDAELKIGGIA